MSWFLGVEIGGTKLQLALGRGKGEPFHAFWRDAIDAVAGASRIREQIVAGVAQLLEQGGVSLGDIAGAGIGFGGPVDTRSGLTMVSHQVGGWKEFPLGPWMTERFGWPAVLHNDADSAALAEASFGAGRGFDPVMYVTVGSGIGGGLVCGGEVFRGSGAGALEIGHLRPQYPALRVRVPGTTVESIASGFGMEQRARAVLIEQAGQAGEDPRLQRLLSLAEEDPARVTAHHIAKAAAEGDTFCLDLLADATDILGWALAQAITLINPARIVIGGGVSLIGETLFLGPVRTACRASAFPPFRDIAEIVPAALGEDVVVHGALAIARSVFSASAAGEPGGVSPGMG